MDVGDIKFYVKRWRAVEEFQRSERLKADVNQSWKELNAICRRAAWLGLETDGEDGEMDVILRWARLKTMLFLNDDTRN